ncbi:hypothetical protein P153DRAFT_396821 [Dothidotthia symphoricarpi CBS 119687]|uniref:Uncharacterized protein n=1 Tax=Dothidotthia symphoricarpi CBS 119687 TaxID=1392245 RepID=A0A6A6AGK9_9PLEO|nr:uncharacterized protein P153DRAFT_396821 [Dothidotthia symphoricarpi CBS 119687]KAF2129561.1 hypothetical protein P153DRAFT_396821 [Dothidotthia symphoricarpi CBS 119687]
MPSTPQDSPHDLLADGHEADLGVAPHTQRLDEFACVINRNFSDPAGQVTYKKGMQGRLLGEHTSQKGTAMAKIFIQGVTEGSGFTNRYVPRDYIDKGPPWQANINDWKIEMNLLTGTFDAQGWNTSHLPDTTTLGKTIAKLITAFRKSPANFMEGRFPTFVDTHGINKLTYMIIDGIKKAGLYAVLTRSDGSFTKDDLINAAKYTITPGCSFEERGIYGRFHLTGSVAPYWKPATTYGYVGKSVNMVDQYSQHERDATTTYGDLTRSSEYAMIALCILPPQANSGLLFLAEQVLVCLLQTYRQTVYDANPEIRRIDLQMAAKYFVDISDATFRLTGWCGAVLRPSFGVQCGANLSSPLLEYCDNTDKLLFVRTDSVIKDVLTGRSTPISVFRRSTPRTVTATSNSPRVVAFCKRSGTKLVISFSYTIDRADESFAPLPGTPHQVVFEVYKDGTPHPHSWTRLCDIGRFKNWDQARSFAIRIEWEHPPNSGKWLSKYIHAGKPRGSQSWGKATGAEHIPGALEHYAKGISFLQWLFDAPPNHNHPWIARWKGSARVIQSNYDSMNQRIILKIPTEKIRMIVGRVRKDKEIIAQMKDKKYCLENVDGQFGEFGGQSNDDSSNRKECDCCTLNHPQTSSSDGGTCKQVGNSRVCKNCEHMGRPCCSWTSALRSSNSAVQMSPEDEKLAHTITAALLSRPLATTSNNQVSFTQTLRPFSTSDKQEGDGSDDEPEEYEDMDEEDI